MGRALVSSEMGVAKFGLDLCPRRTRAIYSSSLGHRSQQHCQNPKIYFLVGGSRGGLVLVQVLPSFCDPLHGRHLWAYFGTPFACAKT